MKRNRNFASLILLVFVVALLVGCSMGVKKGFLATQTSFNDMVDNYVTYYNAVPAEEQAKLKKNVHPIVKEALDISMKMNKAILDGIEIPKIDQKKFRNLRFELYRKLPKIFEKEG